MSNIEIIGMGTANPPLRLPQETAFEVYTNLVPLSDRAKSLMQRIFVNNHSIGYRHLALDTLTDVLEDNQDKLIARYQKYGVRVAVEAANRALENAGLTAEEIDALVVNTCTGYLCPGLTSYVAEALPLKAGVHPFDLQGMGCGGALPNLQTAYNFLQAHPDSNVLSIAVEICSATLYLDESPDILISNALFGDGAAAAVLTNRAVSGRVRLQGFSAGLYPQDRQHLYYRTENSKLRNVLSVDVPTVGASRGKEVIDRLLAQTGRGYQDIQHWILHPGGQKVLDAFEGVLPLPENALAASRKVLYDYGNMSSATVLFVLDEVLRNQTPQAGDTGLMCSFGAGFGVYAGLVEFV
jgi:predicted naringenin-chalcone synthase